MSKGTDQVEFAQRLGRRKEVEPPQHVECGADCTPNHLCNGRMVHLPGGEMCNKCGVTLARPLPFNAGDKL